MIRTTRTPFLLAFGAAAVLLAGCGGADTAAATDDDPGQAAPGNAMCAPDMPDCVDVVTDDGMDDGSDTRPSDDTMREQAQSLLGTPEGELPADVRIGRRGDEHMMLTEDYVIGRMTVALEDDGTGTFVVTEITLELEDGPEVITN